ncbi:toprim domain-containing protein [Brevundimonas bullata]|uniref:toprim domain-containing protein n=1 Tax=Brevundimonas bullata TaxID=13160 RepID=UPI003D9A5F5C
MSLHPIVAALGGELRHGGLGASVPAPGHSAADRSVSLMLDGDRVVIHGFGAADWRSVRDHLLSLGLIDARGRLTGASLRTAEGPVAAIRPAAHVRIAAAQALWSEALPLAKGDLCFRYFRSRGLRLEAPPHDLRRHPATPVSVFRSAGPTCPALIAAIRAPDGVIGAVEIAYLDPDGRPAGRLRLQRKTVGVLPRGSAVRLCAAAPTLLVAEGVATALSAMARFRLPGWALLSAGNLAAWTAPTEVCRVLIAADRGPAGEDAASRLRTQLEAAGLGAAVRLPPPGAGDWNDAAT